MAFKKPYYWIEVNDGEGVRPVTHEEHRAHPRWICQSDRELSPYRYVVTYFCGIDHQGKSGELFFEPNAAPLVYATLSNVAPNIYAATRAAALEAHRALCLKHLGREPKSM